MFIITELKYQLLRNKNRSVLTVVIAALLVGCMAFYIGNIQSNEAALHNLSESVPVKVNVVSRNGGNRTNITIDEAHFKALTEAGTHDALYISCAAGSIAEKVESDDMFFGGDTSITGANDIRAVSGLLQESMEFVEGFDASFFTGNEAVCAVRQDYAEKNGLKLGDEITLPIYGIRYATMGPVYQAIGNVSLKVIGTYPESSDSGFTPPQMSVPINWLKEVSEKGGVEFYYESLSVFLDDPMNLNAFKENLPKMGFMQVFADAKDATSGDAVSVEDELFIKTAGELQKNLTVFRGFLIPFFILVIGLVTLVTFLMLRSSQREMAIASSLGRSKRQNGLGYFLGIILADLIGCIIVLPILYFAAGIPMAQILAIIRLFMLCACIGIVLALIFLLRFDTLALLTKVD